ncbi:hypothetical protein ACFSO0_06310 [Brevibacillus sp. GCM10020057]|uniref:hypothetical protein n=1 Tax=Brevibacillus sp. GCM10020057 TaxID=3317327 RepID=UPI00363707AA
MKKLAMVLVTAALMLQLAPLDETLSFLTSEKKQVSPVSTGSNEDVFVTDTSQIVLKTKVEKRIKIRRTVNADGSSSQTTDSSLSVANGVQRVVFVPQREFLDLNEANITVTGEAASEVTIQRIYGEKDGKEIVFEVAHSYQKARGKRKSETERGELHVTALGGFYSLTIPLTLSTSYNESTSVTEEAAPSQPNQPGTPANPGTTPGTPATPADSGSTPHTPDTPDPEGNTTAPAQPPSPGADTPATPSTDPSGPAPPAPAASGGSSAPDTQESTPSGSPSTPGEPSAGAPASL